jgi:hypothetical protein
MTKYHNMTTEHGKRFEADLIRMAGGEEPIEIYHFHDGFSAYFLNEISALRVANRCAMPMAVKQVTNGWWRIQTRNSMSEAA